MSDINKRGYTIPGYRKIPVSRLRSAVCRVMCDYCNFKCARCLARNKESLFRYITDNLKPIEN